MQKSKNISVEEVIRKFSPELKVIAKKYYIAGGGEDDLYQEGMIGMVQAINGYDKTRGDINSEQFKKFVLMCAKRQILDAIKQANRKKNSPLNNYVSFDNKLDSMSESTETTPTALNPELILLQKEGLEERNEEINLTLSSFEKQVLDLYLDGISQSEIAQLFDKSIKSIDNCLQRVKNKLKGKKA